MIIRRNSLTVLCFLSLFLIQNTIGQNEEVKSLFLCFKVQSEANVKSASFSLLNMGVKVNISGVSNVVVDLDLVIEDEVRWKKNANTRARPKAIWADDENIAIPKTFNAAVVAYLSDVPVLVEIEMMDIQTIKLGIDKEGAFYLVSTNGQKPSIAIQFWIESWQIKSSQLLKETQINILI